jgi:hypothetical protein
MIIPISWSFLVSTFRPLNPGLAVDLTAHISYAYVSAVGEPKERVITAMETLAWPVLQVKFLNFKLNIYTTKKTILLFLRANFQLSKSVKSELWIGSFWATFKKAVCLKIGDLEGNQGWTVLLKMAGKWCFSSFYHKISTVARLNFIISWANFRAETNRPFFPNRPCHPFKNKFGSWECAHVTRKHCILRTVSWVWEWSSD